jgi:transcriptional regulator with XRE-family HTH domain
VRHKLLRKLRTERELNQRTVEEACDIKPNVLTQYECGRINLPLPVLEALAKYYDVPVATLLTEQSRKELVAVAQRISSIIGAKFSLDAKAA